MTKMAILENTKVPVVSKRDYDGIVFYYRTEIASIKRNVLYWKGLYDKLKTKGMTILHSETYEREGNDAWLNDKIQIIQEDGELILRHKINHKGWNGELKETREISLEEFSSMEAKQKRVTDYMENECLTPEMAIPNLSTIFSNEY